MKRHMITRLFFASAIVIGYSAPTYAAKTPSYEIAAQKIVDDTLKQHPELQILVMHVTPPGGAENVIIASNIGHIGKKADPDDLRVAGSGKSEVEYDKKGNRFEVGVPLKTETGVIIGALASAYPYDAAVPLSAIENKAQALGKEVSGKIASLEQLFTPVDASAPNSSAPSSSAP